MHAGLQAGFKFISVSVQQNVALGGAEELRVHPACSTVLPECVRQHQLTGLLGVSGHGL